MKARLLLVAGGILASGTTRAGPLSVEPLIGLSSEYVSNPYLLASGAQAKSDEALLLDAPVDYDLNAAHFTVDPGLRYSDSGSYASLASNYFHLKSSALWQSDLDTLAVKAGIGRDSSLYQFGLFSNGVGVRTDASNATIDWQRILTARSQFELGGGWSRVLYNEGAAGAGLVDYRYLNSDASWIYLLSERDTLHLIASGGQYQALDQITESRNYALRLGLDRRLTEVWNLSTALGYAKSDNSEKIYEGPFYIGSTEYGPYYEGTVHATQRGPVFNVGLTRNGETFNVTASASRAYLPSGFEYLSRQDIAELDLSDVRSERWTYGAAFSYKDTATPTPSGALATVHYFSGQLSADWHWTLTWLITLHLNWVSVKYELPPISAQSSGVTLEISRQFPRIDL